MRLKQIIDVSAEVNRLNNDQNQIEKDLSFIFSQQNDLEQSIIKLENAIDQMPLSKQQTNDTNRIEMYKLLIEVDNQLKTMSVDLRDIILRLNDTNLNFNDPIIQISKILNAHMDSLNWIEENACKITLIEIKFYI
jgi:nuclear pore complex protein Nup62